jgi:Protein of unknown function (DUF2934)
MVFRFGGVMMEIESRIRDRAYAMWEAAGRPEGCAVDHWLAAEAKARAPRVRRASSSTDRAATKRRARKTKAAAAPGDSR